jgi:hypothetical protein
MGARGTKRSRLHRASAVIVALFLSFLAAQVNAPTADKAPKSYPEKGKVVAASVSEHTEYVPISPADSKRRSGGGEAFVHRNWVYRVETDDGFYDLDGSTKKRMAAGDTMEFRVVKDASYVRSGNTEVKYRVLSISAKPTK